MAQPSVELRFSLTESQAETLQQRLATLPFKAGYQEEQHGPALMVSITCTPAQEKMLRDILNDLGVTDGDRH